MRMRLFFAVLATEARKLMSYRVDFWLNAVAGLAAGVLVPYFLWKSIFAHASAETIGSRTFEELLLYYILAVLLGRLVQGPDLVQHLANDIYQGELSRYLVYPTAYLPFKYAQHLGFGLTGLIQITVFGTLFAIALDLPAGVVITPGAVARGVVSVALGNLLYFLMAYPIQALAFWADNVWSLAVLLRFVVSLCGGLLLPLDLFPDLARELLLYTPFPYLFWGPVLTVTGELGPVEWLQGVGVSLVWIFVIYALGRGIWRRGEFQYTGVGM